MVIVYCGELGNGGTCRMRMEALQKCGHTVVGIDASHSLSGFHRLAARLAYKVGYAIDATKLNETLLDSVARQDPDILWIDKGLAVKPVTLRAIRRSYPKAQLVHYSPDDVTARHKCSIQSLRSIPLYDLHVTTKSFNLADLRRMGAREILLLNNAYSSEVHRPMDVDPQERIRYGGPVGFIGAFERRRAESLLFLAEHGIPVRVWGGWGQGWSAWAARHKHPNLQVEIRALWCEAYAKAICSFDINLAFLNRWKRSPWCVGAKVAQDLQTTRSVEIPACGGFMLGERTSEHLELFEDGVQAAFYSDREELLTKCRYYLDHADERLGIAKAGRQRCLDSGYSYRQHVRAVLQNLTATTPSRLSLLSFREYQRNQAL